MLYSFLFTAVLGSGVLSGVHAEPPPPPPPLADVVHPIRTIQRLCKDLLTPNYAIPDARTLQEELAAADSKYNSPSSNDLSGYFLMPIRLKKDPIENGEGNGEKWAQTFLDSRRTFEDIRAELPSLAKLGRTMLWLSPVHPQTMVRWDNPYDDPKDVKVAYNDHLYWVQNHNEVSASLGGEEGLKQLIVEAREKYGIEICLDAVLNHVGHIIGKEFDLHILPDSLDLKGEEVLRVRTDDPRYFRPVYERPARLQVPQELYDKLESEQDPDLVRVAQEAIARHSLANLPSLNHDNPLIQKYLINAYKHFIDLGVRVFRLDAVKHIPMSFLFHWINELNDYAAQKDIQLTFIGELMVYNETALDVFVKDMLEKVKNPERVYFIDFPLTYRLRQFMNPNFKFKDLMNFIKWRERQQHSQIRYIPMLEDHDFNFSMSDPFIDQMTHIMAQFLSYNPVVLHHGEEGSATYHQKTSSTRRNINGIDPTGHLGQRMAEMDQILKTYRTGILFNQAIDHLVEDNRILLEKVGPGGGSLFMVAHKNASTTQPFSLHFRLPKRLAKHQLRFRFSENGQGSANVTVGLENGQLMIQGQGPFVLIFEVAP